MEWEFAFYLVWLPCGYLVNVAFEELQGIDFLSVTVPAHEDRKCKTVCSEISVFV